MRLLAGVAIFASLATAESDRIIRGVAPGDLQKYRHASTVGEFECGGKLIPVASINDDFCDCEDGSDEPGTTACANAKFYCPNVGFSEQVLSTSRVNDGVCDCCDGSDEFARSTFPVVTGEITSAACPNTCETLGEKLAIARAETERKRVAGLAAKAELTAAADAKFAEWEAVVEDGNVKMPDLHAQINRLRDTVEVERRMEEAERVSAPVAGPLAELDFTAADGEVPVARNTIDTHWLNAALGEFVRDAEGGITGVHLTECAQPNPYLKETDDSVQAARLPPMYTYGLPAIVFPVDDAADEAASFDAGPTPPQPVRVVIEYKPPAASVRRAGLTVGVACARPGIPGGVEADVADDLLTKVEWLLGDPTDVPWFARFASVKMEDPLDVPREDGTEWRTTSFIIDSFGFEQWGCQAFRLWVADFGGDACNDVVLKSVKVYRHTFGHDEAMDIRKATVPADHTRRERVDAEGALARAEGELREVEHKVAEARKMLEKDWGPEGSARAFAALQGKCTRGRYGQYDYELCAFDTIRQIPLSGYGTVELGRFSEWAAMGDYSSWIGGMEKYATQRYTDGTQCWSGPRRSTVVKVVCSEEETVSDIAEPSMCVYELTWGTPAACV